MERLRPDGTRLSWRLLVPGGEAYRRPWPFFIQWDQDDLLRLKWESAGKHINRARLIRGLHILVSDLDGAVSLYRQLGFKDARRSPIADLAADSAVFEMGDFDIVLLTPRGQGPVAKALAADGEGPFQVVLGVSRLALTRRWLSDRGISFVPAPGEPGGQLTDPSRALGARLVFRGNGSHVLQGQSLRYSARRSSR